MNIYIPRYLRKIKVVDDLCNMLTEYAEFYEPGEQVDNIVDPVEKFLNVLCRPVDGEEIDYKYLSHLFYSVKGTIKVLEYMKELLNLDLTYSYSTKLLQINVDKVELTLVDEGTFRNMFIDFLNALLYFKDLDLSIDVVDMHLTSELPSYTGLGVILVNKVEGEIYDS